MAWFWRATFAISVVATCYLTLTPLENPPRLPAGSDKVIHFAIFAIDALLALAAFRGRSRRLSLLGLLVLGALLEVLQGRVPGRMPSLADALANWAGVLGAASSGWIAKRRRAAGE